MCWVVEGLGGWSGREACIFFFLTPRNLDSARWGLGTGNLSLRITTLERQDSTPTACGKGSLNEGRGQWDLPGVESSQQLRGRGHQDSQHFVPGIRDRWSRGAWSPRTVKFPGSAVPSMHACTQTHFHGVRGQGPQRARFTCIPACDPSHSRGTQTGEAYQARPPQFPPNLNPRGKPSSMPASSCYDCPVQA